eukprot:jgi/Mesvir1/19280/Mv10356-RA.1
MRVSPGAAERLVVQPTCGRRQREEGAGKPREDKDRGAGRRALTSQQQFEMNSLIVRCTSGDEILDVVDSARKTGIALSGVNMATAVSCIAKDVKRRRSLVRDPRFAALLESIWQELSVRPATINARGLSSLAYSLVKMQVEVHHLEPVEREITRRGMGEFTCQGISNTVWAFATAGCAARQLYAVVEAEVVSRGLAEFSAQSIANTMWSFATVGYGSSAMFRAVEEEVLSRGLPDFHSQGIASLVWAFAKVSQGGERLFEAVEVAILARGLGEFNAQGVVNCLWAFATTGRGGRQLYDLFEETLTARRLHAFSPQGITNALWAFATAGRGAPPFYSMVEAEVVSRGFKGFTPQGIANTVWAFATAGYESEGIYEVVEAETVRRGLRGFTSQGIVNTMWAFATAGRGSPQLYAAVEAEVVVRGLSEFNPQDIANVVWAFAKAGRGSHRLYQVVLDEITLRGMGGFNAQNIANTIWAFATVDRACDELCALVAAEVVARGLGGFSPQSIANTMWAFACTGYDNRQLYAAVEAAVVSRGLADFNAQCIVNTLWAFAKAREGGKPFFDAMEAEVVARGMQEFTPQSTANILWAFSTSGRGGDRLYTILESAIARWLDTDMDASISLGSEGEQGDDRTPAVGGGEASLQPRPSAIRFSTQNVGNVLWALAVAHRCNSAVARSLLEEVRHHLTPETSVEALAQMALYVWACVGRDERARTSGAPAAVLRVLQQARANGRLPLPSSSRFHMEVSNTLRSLGVEHTNEVPILEGLYFVDIVVGTPESGEATTTGDPTGTDALDWVAGAASGAPGPDGLDGLAPSRDNSQRTLHSEAVRAEEAGMGLCELAASPASLSSSTPAHMVAVEVDGPSHFMSDGRQMTPATLLKRDLMMQHGWQVISVPYFEWALLSTLEDKRLYLRTKLLACGVFVSPNCGQQRVLPGLVGVNGATGNVFAPTNGAVPRERKPTSAQGCE